MGQDQSICWKVTVKTNNRKVSEAIQDMLLEKGKPTNHPNAGDRQTVGKLLTCAYLSL